MPSPVINTTAGETVAREAMILYLNTSTTSSPTWSAIGKRVTDSAIEQDWSTENEQDILGNTFITAKKPVLTQSFDSYYVDSEDLALTKIYDLGVIQQNAQALCNLDLLVVHFYSGATATPFAERYPQSSIVPTSLGGEGGGNLAMALDCTFGGERVVGTASRGTGGAISFTPAA